MNLQDFERYVMKQVKLHLNRCMLINEIITVKADWSYIIRTFLFFSNEKVIAKQYLLDKIRFMLNNPNDKHKFMDFYRTKVYFELKAYLQDLN